MDNLILDYIKEQKNELTNEWMARMRTEADERVLKLVSEHVFNGTSAEFVDLISSSLGGSKEEFRSKLSDFAEKVVRLGWPLHFVIEGVKTFSKMVFEGMQEKGYVTDENQMAVVYAFDRWISPLQNEVVDIYSRTWERTVSLQKIALQELSAPLIPVFEKITVMPLIGTIDTERAKQIMENLLTGVVRHGSEVVLIDITGVPVVDTMVAHHIIQAAEAVRLVGAKCMLVGIRPEIAQTIVNLGIDLNQFTTKNTLKKGVEAALELTNRKIIQVEGAR
ncbi:STAS domain-containing protein [Neobacillus notoginsengisoli]|uniref:STAS domain-containing protein n=1 Tax=Neobacillus notoginsengisoli TaxID=1578198 RepID=A0A417YD58_9BACI|nr:RsbT co-antagonist protein RsbRA [Neobacillus notoginsengisoli]RHW30557.1 STAS domain-containing protein [Neobacillus notoginsengisoli]